MALSSIANSILAQGFEGSWSAGAACRCRRCRGPRPVRSRRGT